jgi:hypothetical protein
MPGGNRLALETHFKQQEEPKNTNGNGAWHPSDGELLEKAFAARNGDKLKRLFNGDTSDRSGDDSAADLSLCSLLAFWTQDPAQIDRIFRRSGLMRDKWDSRRGDSTYGAWTIGKALADRKEHYAPRRNGNGIAQHREWQRSEARQFWPELLSAKDLLSLPPDTTRWVWKDCLPFGSGSVLVAKPKIGKTTLAVNLSITISRDIRFLGRDTIQSPVAYLSLDASLPEIAETFHHFGLRETDSVFIHAGAAPADAISWLVERIKEKGVRFVVIDTLQRLFRFQNLNDYSEVTNTLEPLLEAIREQKAHTLMLHHAKKDAGDDLDSAIGSTAIRGLAYAYLHLKRLPNSERRILRSDQQKRSTRRQELLGTASWF